MKLPPTIVAAGRLILDLFLPQSCIACGKEGAALCDKCCLALPRAKNAQRSTRRKSSLAGVVSLLRYEDPLVKRICNALKHDGVTDLGTPLGRRLVSLLEKLPVTPTHVVPIPLARKRRRMRSYNQAHLLAEPLATALNLTCSTDLLNRIRSTPPQQGLDRAQRAANVRGAFQCTKRLPKKSYILLVDDVATSGATLSEAARALHTAGAETVWAITLASRALT